MKKMLFVLAAFAMGLAVMPNVYAEDAIVDEGKLNSAITAAKTSGGTITIGGNITVTGDIVKIENASAPITIDLNGYTISRTTAESNTVFSVIGTSNVTFKDSKGTGKVDKIDTSSIYVKNGATVTIESGTYNGGIVVWGEGSTLNVKGGTINANSFAIAGNGSNTTNSTINITGGNITSNNTAAIYHPQTGTLNISNGNIAGKIGVVARQGEVNITGGDITATGTDTGSVGDAKDASGNKVQLPLGVAVIVDNTEEGYANPANVTISGGNFKTTSADPVVSIGKSKTDIQVEAGATFDKTVNSMFLAEGLIQDVHGKVATRASLKPDIPAKEDEKTTDKTEEENTPIAPGAQAPDTTDVKNPDTADNFYSLISMLSVSAAGLFIAFKKIALN